MKKTSVLIAAMVLAALITGWMANEGNFMNERIMM